MQFRTNVKCDDNNDDKQNLNIDSYVDDEHNDEKDNHDNSVNNYITKIISGFIDNEIIDGRYMYSHKKQFTS